MAKRPKAPDAPENPVAHEIWIWLLGHVELPIPATTVARALGAYYPDVMRTIGRLCAEGWATKETGGYKACAKKGSSNAALSWARSYPRTIRQGNYYEIGKPWKDANLSSAYVEAPSALECPSPDAMAMEVLRKALHRQVDEDPVALALRLATKEQLFSEIRRRMALALSLATKEQLLSDNGGQVTGYKTS